MKFNKKAVALVVSLGLGIGAVQSFADGKKTNMDASAKPAVQGSAIDRLALSDALIGYGDAENDPMALILAAKIKRDVGSTDASYEKTSTGGKGDAGKKDKDSSSMSAVLDRAKEMAGERKDLLAMIADVEESSSRGDITGPNRHRDIVLAGATDVYEINFEGGESAQVLIEGDGDTDLDLFIEDENGNSICSDTDRTDTMLCVWEPRWTGTFRIQIQNLGRVANIYTLYTN